jgi:hypothetical protein
MDLIDRGTEETHINLTLVEGLILGSRKNIFALDIEGREMPAMFRYDPAHDST